jgi:Rps23 Pro-64 3,4-dihydroxylase Tpa1-like proline 4-hydroxylase
VIRILHDVLDGDLREEILNHNYDDAETNGLGDFWYNQNLLNLKFDSVKAILKIVNDYVDLSDMAGFEMHHNYTDYVSHHVDKDEILFSQTGETRLPIVGIVYYPLIKELNGGTFYTDHLTVEPKANSMIIFPSVLLHGVSPVIRGERVSVGINPWPNPPFGYERDK